VDAYLREQKVDHLLVTGLDAADCVNASTRGALGARTKTGSSL
jgi:nicotinamidase-related amidase